VIDPATEPDRAAELLAELEVRHPQLSDYYARLFSGEIERP
jgi:hypothetical protein